MKPRDIARIESTLGVTLPKDYRGFLSSERDDDRIDETSVLDDSDAIIDLTRTYRKGFEGLQPWPERYVYAGDEADACPYLVDCDTGAFCRTDKGDLSRDMLERYPGFSAFVEERLSPPPIGEDAAKETWMDKLRFYRFAIIMLLVWFIVIPLILILLTEGFKAIFRN
ncbi:MAG: SMI1/KNR4 family protein [Lysobacteraceae bacterium]